ncbi:heavy metal-binding domain-containing protein [Escherichia albertii]|uniref:heavy metal-binding domain-containing protein n=1 Tax=Escherichia albertii TaxID=208962 RepID=UPI000743A7BF|nr:heavy metal-binding domain-containing protein [Escherichia albertii]MCU7292434.1 heavy metal-binding domain-containing protein [Escherichia albertii]MCZ8667852.1 heavy metal-binding domain-containing protein [Escherichia albertii]QTA19424.1 heavy metal-binding domain-containing protein [Escherichia albertii]WDC36951.1 heavy metal-binding domain-containing protein [Escherichia albertii]HAX3035292.1 heavy metal-binding domain-containing protein [Escherichia albertii]
MGLFNHKTNISLSAHSNVFTSTPSHMKVIKNFGIVKATTAEISGKYHSEDDELLSVLLSEASKMGANAIVNFQYISGSYNTGNGYFATYIIATGDAVVLEDI